MLNHRRCCQHALVGWSRRGSGAASMNAFVIMAASIPWLRCRLTNGTPSSLHMFGHVELPKSFRATNSLSVFATSDHHRLQAVTSTRWSQPWLLDTFGLWKLCTTPWNLRAAKRMRKQAKLRRHRFGNQALACVNLKTRKTMKSWDTIGQNPAKSRLGHGPLRTPSKGCATNQSTRQL